MKLTTKIRNQAQRTISLVSADQASEYISNLGLVIASATLREQGWYSCTISGTKTLFVVE